MTLVIFLACIPEMYGEQVKRTEARVHYPQGVSLYRGSYKNNNVHLDSLLAAYRRLDSAATLVISASASPEGTPKWLSPLARKRAKHIIEELVKRGVNKDLVTRGKTSIDWKELYDSVSAHPELKWQCKVLDLIELAHNDEALAIHKLKSLQGGRPWRYMLKHYFPAMRYSNVYFEEIIPEPAIIPEAVPTPEPVPEVEEIIIPEPIPEPIQEPVPEVAPTVLPPHYWALKTNMIHDAILVPNIGLEAYVGKQWSVMADYSGAWWGYKYRTKLWRYYGGNIEVRKYLQKELKPLTGWHVGPYVELASYDFQLGLDGYQSKFSWGAGVVGGYMLPISKHFNIDFALGLGYFGGKYKKCHYGKYGGYYHDEWTGTYYRHWWGPTRGEIALVWLLGRDNYNKKKSKEGGKK